ncbi:hypothetical protein ASC89_24675 [Devosia sp. Root413D1]|uniref:COG3904 family protein n=1 Tax=Devosia sp. Root413D1 TaxID=1736531 RepID=UPI0006F418FE|nr:hypothetical protein [Devosia sp. Root413D1]KQW74812.1 hypothetical protein ASC89_24675 [Devosia sp. Root413D1]
MAYLVGALLGGVIGCVFFGGLFGWVIHKLFRLPYSTADASGLLAVILLAGFTNSSPGQSILSTWAFYFVTSVPAYFILERLRLSRAAASAPPELRREPPMHSEPAEPEQSALAAEMELEEEIALSVRAEYPAQPAPPTRRKAQNFIARHWRGELSLPVSYWLISFATNVCGILAVIILTTTFTPNDGYEPAGILVLLAVTWAILVVLLVWQIVGLWRSAARRAEEQFKLHRSAFWARAAQFMAVIGVLQFGASFANTGLPQFTELSRIVFQNDPDIPDATLRISDDARILLLSGGIKYGLAGQVETLLKAAPNIAGLLLSSPGGRVAEAEKVFDLVRSRGLDTFVSDECSSACTLIFVAGRNRLVGLRGLLGFHGSYFPGVTAADLQAANAEWAKLYQSAGLSPEFLDRALQVPPEKMWYPTQAELRQAGVIVGEASKVAALPDGFTPEASLASVRETFVAISGVYEAIDTHAPDRAADIYALGLDLAEGWIDEDTMASRVSGIIGEVVRSRLSGASDDTLVEYAALAAAEYDALLKVDPTACFHYASGTRSINLSNYVPADLTAREVALNERIIRSSGTATFVNRAYLDAIWADVAAAMQTTVTPEQLDVFARPLDQVDQSEHGTYCLAAIAAMQELSKLPAHRAAAALRDMYHRQ